MVVLGVWHLLAALNQLAFLVPLMLQPEDSLPPEQALPFVVDAVAGVGLVLYGPRLARAFLPNDSEPLNDLSAEDLYSFAIAMLGVWIFIDAASVAARVESQLVSTFYRVAEAGFGGDLLSSLTRGHAWQQRLPYLVRIAASLVLFFASGSVVRAWQASRRAGHKISAA